MPNIEIGRYDHPEAVGFQGWIKPTDGPWVVFVDLDGTPVLFTGVDE